MQQRSIGMISPKHFLHSSQLWSCHWPTVLPMVSTADFETHCSWNAFVRLLADIVPWFAYSLLILQVVDEIQWGRISTARLTIDSHEWNFFVCLNQSSRYLDRLAIRRARPLKHHNTDHATYSSLQNVNPAVGTVIRIQNEEAFLGLLLPFSITSNTLYIWIQIRCVL